MGLRYRVTGNIILINRRKKETTRYATCLLAYQSLTKVSAPQRK